MQESLVAALKGSDVVLALLGAPGLQIEPQIVDAAAAAGVKWFVPSEFGHDTTDERVTGLLPVFKSKTAVIDRLRSKEKDGLAWTALITGLFFDRVRIQKHGILCSNTERWELGPRDRHPQHQPQR